MGGGLIVAIALLADPASAGAVEPAPTAAAASAKLVYGPVLPAPPKSPLVKPVEDPCATARAPANAGEIVVCAQRPQGYRLNPDVLEAKREMRGGGRPKPRNLMNDNSCASVGPMGCRGGTGIDLLAAAATAAKMADRLSKGEEIGSMFVTRSRANINSISRPSGGARRGSSRRERRRWPRPRRRRRPRQLRPRRSRRSRSGLQGRSR